MDFVADGKVGSGDVFQLTPIVSRTLVFQSHYATHAHVTLDVTIHPYQEKWPDYSINIAESPRTSNFVAYDYDTSKPLGIIQSTMTDTRQISVRVVFDSPGGRLQLLISSISAEILA